MNIINENNEKCKRYLPHELKTRLNAVLTYRNGNSISYVCRKYHISRVSLYRWCSVTIDVKHFYTKKVNQVV